MIANHIKNLEKNLSKLYNIKTKNNLIIPTCFEYYSAIMLTKIYDAPFNVWKDVSNDRKKEHNFPIRDKGIDIVNEKFSIIGQSKYYKKSCLTYGKLSTFLAIDKIVDKKDFQMVLIRLSESKIDKHIREMISKGILIDFQIDEKDFINKCKELKEL